MTYTSLANAVLLDARNFDSLAPSLIVKISQAKLLGYDIETEDSQRHQGLSDFMGVNDEGHKAGNRPLVFDVNRTVVTGFSLYIDGDSLAYYVNLNHADQENRVSWEKARRLLDALPADGCFVCHNAQFERTMMRCSLKYEFTRPVICTLQMAVSAYGPDEFEPADFRTLDLGAVRGLLNEAGSAFMSFEPGKEMSGAQGQIFAKFIGKESDAAHSYNGWVKTIARPYGLKAAIKYWFGYEMQTFEATLAGRAHMGQLTGDEVVSYGADDSYWCVRLYHQLIQYMMDTNPKAVKAFFEQELPCVEYYSDLHSKGLRINRGAVIEHREDERAGYAITLREMKAAIRNLLPFPTEPHAGLLKYEGETSWYAKGGDNYRRDIANWANTPDETDDYFESQKVRGPISNAWAADLGDKRPVPLSLPEQELKQLKLEETERKDELETLKEAVKAAKAATKSARKAVKAAKEEVKTQALGGLTQSLRDAIQARTAAELKVDLLKEVEATAKARLALATTLGSTGSLKARIRSAKEAADIASVRLSITHYMPARVLLYDLLNEKVVIDKGKVQSDGEARGKLTDRLEKLLEGVKAHNDVEGIKRLEAGLELLRCMAELASVEQRAKLYLNPYLQLTDPETSRVYPVLSSMLASRRMAMSYPNGMQLAKKGDSTYIRGFYEPDYPDHIILSCDWSGIELVLIGELSGDPEFKKAFGQLPYQDLHLGSAASCLSVMWGDEVAEKLGMNDGVLAMETFLKSLKHSSAEEIEAIFPKILVNLKGAHMEPPKALKFWRGTDCGKGANFNYWYSGALSVVGQRLGWTSDQMWKATEKYRERFAVAERWRTDMLLFVQENGFVQLPDGHRRVRFEATAAWREMFMTKFNMIPHPGVAKFATQAARAIQRRAGNQAVNSLIQGTCATMAKRSINRVRQAIVTNGWTDRECRPLIPIHDELLLSVHKDLVVPAIKMVREAMCLPDIVKTLPLTISPAIGRTFEPFKTGNRMTQVELAELSPVPCVDKSRWDQEATDDEVRAVVGWMFE